MIKNNCVQTGQINSSTKNLKVDFGMKYDHFFVRFTYVMVRVW